MELLNGINQFSGLLTFLSFIGVILLFIFSLRSSIRDIRKSQKEHQMETTKIKTVAYDIKEEINRQAIHQEYMRKISEDSTKAITRMNELLVILTGTLNEISLKIKQV